MTSEHRRAKQREYQKTYRERHPDRLRAKAATYRERHPDRVRADSAASRARRSELLDAAKAVPCAACGGEYPSVVMDFHHRDPAAKDFNIGNAGRNVSITRLKRELAKCDVLCANCHRLHHYKEAPVGATA